MSKIFFIAGKSSTGKDTIYNRLINNKELDLKSLKSYTTRPIRKKEKNGREYFFVSEKEMFELEDKGKIIERRTYNTICGDWHYFLVDDGQVSLENDNYLLIGTLESYKKVKDFYGNENVIPIYIEIDDCERLERAFRREKKQNNPNITEMCRRFVADQEDFSEENIKKLDIKKRYINMDLDKCLEEISKDISIFTK